MEKRVVPLEKPHEGLFVSSNMEGNVWFSPDAVLMVFASEFYDETNYIRKYRRFFGVR